MAPIILCLPLVLWKTVALICLSASVGHVIISPIHIAYLFASEFLHKKKADYVTHELSAATQRAVGTLPIAVFSFMLMSLLPRACRNSCTNSSAFSVVTPIGPSSVLSLTPFRFVRPGAIIAQRKSVTLRSQCQ